MNSNVDKDEVEKFALLAARWWDKNSEFKPLHDINPLRLNYIKEQCGGSLQGKRILDIGCGGGILSESLALEGATVVGIDLAEAGLEVAKLHLLESGLDIDYKFISAEELALISFMNALASEKYTLSLPDTISIETSDAFSKPKLSNVKLKSTVSPGFN